MRRDNDKSVSFYTTLDAYQAGFLTLRGFIPQLVDQNGKVIFAFVQTEELLKALSEYYAGAVVEASRFASTIKTLKSRIHSMRKNKENFNGKEKDAQ